MKAKNREVPHMLRSDRGAKRQKSFRTLKINKFLAEDDDKHKNISATESDWWCEKDGESQFVNKGLKAWEENRKKWLKRDGSGQAAPRERSLTLLIALHFSPEDDDVDAEYKTEDEEGFFS
jgi:hypothetical protein